jgi:SAM-dependent methyltransferase
MMAGVGFARAPSDPGLGSEPFAWFASWEASDMPEGWEWDETLYRGSAPYYAPGRQPYAPGLAERLAAALELDGTGRLLDVGCGPGIVTLPLAPWFAEVIGLDADADMLAEAARRASDAGIGNARWVHARAETLPLGLGTFRLVTFAQSFHWLDRERVASVVRAMLEPGGALVYIADEKVTRTRDDDLPYPAPPHAEIQALIERELGPIRRAGQGFFRHNWPSDEATIFRAGGFTGPDRLLVPATEPFVRDLDAVVAGIYSLSGSAPHLFGDRLAAFDAELRALLAAASPQGRFVDPPANTEAMIWRVAG